MGNCCEAKKSYSTIILPFNFALILYFLLTPSNALPLIGALAVANGINSCLSLESRVRWPNDVVVGGRKVAGALVEAKFVGEEIVYALLGVGINANFRAEEIGKAGLAGAWSASCQAMGLRLGPTTFGIFDAFPDEAGRQAHLSGKVAAALMAKASELFAHPPVIEKVEILAAKLP